MTNTPYYVYKLIDPRSNETFYVGKGKGRRMFNHEREATKGIYSRKCAQIRSILAEGLSIVYEIVRRFDNEAEAYRFEKELITEIGLRHLTNVQPGGVVTVFPQPKYTGWTIKGLRAVAPKLARALRQIIETGGASVCGVDVTNDILELYVSLKRDCGDVAVRSALRAS